jgi:hypothetical protein
VEASHSRRILAEADATALGDRTQPSKRRGQREAAAVQIAQPLFEKACGNRELDIEAMSAQRLPPDRACRANWLRSSTPAPPEQPAAKKSSGGFLPAGWEA